MQKDFANPNNDRLLESSCTFGIDFISLTNQVLCENNSFFQKSMS